MGISYVQKRHSLIQWRFLFDTDGRTECTVAFNRMSWQPLELDRLPIKVEYQYPPPVTPKLSLYFESLRYRRLPLILRALPGAESLQPKRSSAGKYVQEALTGRSVTGKIFLPYW